MADEEFEKATAGLEWRVDPLLGKTLEKVKNYLETEHTRLRAQYRSADSQCQNADSQYRDFDPESDIDLWLDDMKDLVDAMDEFVVDVVADMERGRDDG